MDNEVKGDGNSYTTEFRQLDPRLGRWLSIDPKYMKYRSFSPYNSMGNNPILINDPLGDDLIGLSTRSGERTKQLIDGSFMSAKSQGVKDLFKLGSDGQTFQKIDSKSFENALKDLTDEEKALARGYYDVVNDNKRHVVSVIKPEEEIGATLAKYFDPVYKTRTGKTLNASSKGAVFDELTGGVNLSEGNKEITVVVLNSGYVVGDCISTLNGQKESHKSDAGEALAHELLGHGLTSKYGSDDDQWKNAIYLSNIYLKIQGKTYYRDGSTHEGNNGRTISLSNSATIPSYLKKK